MGEGRIAGDCRILANVLEDPKPKFNFLDNNHFSNAELNLGISTFPFGIPATHVRGIGEGLSSSNSSSSTFWK